eukprot:GILJ01014774.1.p1 GENE.GILJ01014774.1~~GILJ01014774.1.p1  ORF type:complete len:660 (-),score=90.59 GILJ01014774.1:229-2061(-)
MIESYLKVNPVVGQLAVHNGDCGVNYGVSSADNANGVNNTDFYILISAGPVNNRQTLAYASPCVSDPNNRPLIGRINFNPYFVAWDSLDPSANNENLVLTAHHEMIHSLGFTSTFFAANGRTASGTARGKTVNRIVTPTVAAMAQQYFGCPNITGVELEDEGASGSVGAHWDRRILFEELMGASAGSRASIFTLAYFKDLGFYDVDMDKAVPMSFGKGAGCPFIDQKCNTAGGGLGEYWCLDAPSSDPAKSCTFDRRGIGYCNSAQYSSSLSSSFQYYSDPTIGGIEFVDRCPYIAAYSNRECAYQRDYNGDTTTAQGEADLGFYFGDGGRCFDTTGLQKGLASTSDNLRCLQARCPFNGSRVEVKVGDTWLCCPLDGSSSDSVTPPAEFTGLVKCPAATEVCDSDISYGSNQPESKPVGNTELPTNVGTAKVTAELVFNGTGWETVVASDRQRVDLYNSIRMDVAMFLRISSASVLIRRSSIVESGSIVSKGLSVLVGIIDDDQQAISSAIFNQQLSASLYLAAPVPWTRDAYARYSGTSDSTVIAGYVVEEKRSDSICSSSISPDRCIMIIGICVTIGSALIIAVLMYCLCFKSPFDIPPQPKGLSVA